MFGEGWGRSAERRWVGGGGEGGETSAELGNCLHFWLLQKPPKNEGHHQDLRSKGIKRNTSLRNLEKPCFLTVTVIVSLGEEITGEDYWNFLFKSNLLLFSIFYVLSDEGWACFEELEEKNILFWSLCKSSRRQFWLLTLNKCLLLSWTNLLQPDGVICSEAGVKWCWSADDASH